VEEIHSTGDELQYKVNFEIVTSGRKTIQSKIFDLKQLAYDE
jgi:hypothetical protein